jgi:hypothetical protein
MIKAVFACTSIFILAIVVAPAVAGAQTSNVTRVPRVTSSRPDSTADDCKARIRKLDASDAEGEERLAEKYKVIDVCDRQYEHDNTIEGLVEECAKFTEQPVVKQQFMADCQLAAFNYANALRALKQEYKQ